MNMSAVTLRTALATVALVSASAAHADLTIPFNATQSNSVQTFTEDDLGGFDLVNISVSAKGNASAVGTQLVGGASGATYYAAYSFPITKVVIGSNLAIKSGSAVGSALFFDRLDDDTGLRHGLTLANFTIDYVNKKVLADITIQGGTTAAQQPIYTFTVDSKLALKYKFPFTVTGHEVLSNLFLTPESKAAFKNGLVLPEIADSQLEISYGTLTQDINTNLRKKAVPTTPYVAQ